ncbi:MAG: glycerophosphodiester phosphodiesterase family protein [Pelagimonas sp.]|jgi:glycerophosphoryl diester phosphodiesterase|nr:glycerophosphodiester phosphodiesterase family protein [Pelagimonas sp.]
MPQLPDAFLTRPIAHRALHDLNDQRPENSRAAIRAAINAGYGIEIDLQLSNDGQAMVFHDYGLARLTDETGPIHQRTAAELGRIPLLQSSGEGIPTLGEVLDLIAGQVPLLIELKDQDGAMGPDVGPLEHATAQALCGYGGPVALMSFNPHSVALLAELAPDIPRGLTTESYPAEHWPTLNATTRGHLRMIPDFDRVGASFVSHNHRHLDSPALLALHKRGVPILCWTTRSPEEEAAARRIVKNVTFEGYAA